MFGGTSDESRRLDRMERTLDWALGEIERLKTEIRQLEEYARASVAR